MEQNERVDYFPNLMVVDSCDEKTICRDIVYVYGTRARDILIYLHGETNKCLYSYYQNSNMKCEPYIDKDKVWVKRSLSYLSNQLIIGKTVLKETLKKLKDDGVIIVRRDGHGNVKDSNFYAIDYDRLQEVISSQEDERINNGVVARSPFHPQKAINNQMVGKRPTISRKTAQCKSENGSTVGRKAATKDINNNKDLINNTYITNSRVSDNSSQMVSDSKNSTQTSASGSQSEASIIIRHGEDNYSEDGNVNVTKEYSDDNNKADVNFIRQDANDFIEYMRAELTKEQRDSNNKADVNYPAKLDANSIPEGEDALDVLEERIELDDPEYGLFKDALTFVREYPLYYNDFLGKEHPELSNKKKLECFNAIVPLMRKYYLEFSDVYEIMMLCFSADTDTSDKRIYHFVDPNVFKYFHGVYREKLKDGSLQVANQ